MKDSSLVARKMLLDGFPQIDVVKKTGLSRSAVAGIAYRMREKGEPVAKHVKKPVEATEKKHGPHIVYVPRARDEEVLLWIKRRRAKMPMSEIALRSGTGSGQVSMAVESVRKADLAESGEDPRIVAMAYWEPPVAFGRHGRGKRK